MRRVLMTVHDIWLVKSHLSTFIVHLGVLDLALWPTNTAKNYPANYIPMDLVWRCCMFWLKYWFNKLCWFNPELMNLRDTWSPKSQDSEHSECAPEVRRVLLRSGSRCSNMKSFHGQDLDLHIHGWWDLHFQTDDSAGTLAFSSCAVTQKTQTHFNRCFEICWRTPVLITTDVPSCQNDPSCLLLFSPFLFVISLKVTLWWHCC